MSLYIEYLSDIHKNFQAAYNFDTDTELGVSTIFFFLTENKHSCRSKAKLAFFWIPDPLKRGNPPKSQYQKSDSTTILSLPYMGKRK